MQKIIKINARWISLISLIWLSGCTTPGKNLLPHGDMTMAQIYRAQTGLEKPNAANEADPKDEPASNVALAKAAYRIEKAVTPEDTHYMQAAQNQINRAFKVVPNPNIPAYIFAHMAHYNHTNVPVPGYTTAFFLYESNHYAMPEEAY